MDKSSDSPGKSEVMYRSLFNTMLNGVAYCKVCYANDGTVDLQFVSVNKAFETLTGVKNVAGKMASEVIPGFGETNADMYALYVRVARTGNPERVELYSKILSNWFSIAAYSYEKDYVVIVFDVITERKQTENALSESEKRYRVLFNSMNEGFALHEIICDAYGKPIDYRFLDMNPAFERLTGLNKAVVVGKTVLTIMPSTEAVWIEKYGKVALTGISTSFENFSSPLNRYYHVVAFSPQQNQFAVVFNDITDRIQAENAIAEEKERLAVTLRSIGDGVITTDIHGTIVLMNKVAEEYTGWKQQEAQGKPIETVFTIINGITRKPHDNPVQKVIATGKIVELANQTHLISRSGIERIIADSGAPIIDKNSITVGVVLVFRDITEKQQLQDSIQRTDKLECIGVLAGGIAHDFNNLLGGIYGYIDLARDTCPPDSDAVDYLNKAIKTFSRAKDLTQQLLTFAKGGAPSRITASLAPLIKEWTQFALSGSAVGCSFIIADDLWLCDFDENMMGQVIDNIVINAVQAMPLGGTLSVTAENCEINQGEKSTVLPGEYVHIAIADTGVGIPRSIMSKIFDPFFTTKQQGNGLGLATVHSIIIKHDGQITVESEPDKGTTFHIYLPASKKSAGLQTAIGDSSHKGSGRILIMDDEDAIRETVGEMLGKMGYDVAFARTGEEALEIIKKASDDNNPFLAAIMDLTIPGGMGGVKAIRQLRKTNTTMPVFVASGYSVDPVMSNPADYGFTDKLHKPFLKSEVADLFMHYFGAGNKTRTAYTGYGNEEQPTT
jgi:PAS domain S-box-containing protein